MLRRFFACGPVLLLMPVMVTDGAVAELVDHLKSGGLYESTWCVYTCDIKPRGEMVGLDLRDTKQLRQRDRVYVEANLHDTHLDQLNDTNNGLKARVMISGWDKRTWRPDKVELFDLKSDPDDGTDLFAQNAEHVKAMSGELAAWLDETPSPNTR